MLELNIHTAKIILLCITLFVTIGTLAPALAMTYMPQSSFIEVHEFEPGDTYTGDESHNICLNRTVKRPATADINIELRVVKDDGTLIEKDSFEIDAYYQEGQEKIIINREIRDDSLEPGRYTYLETVSLNYYNGWIEKDFTFVSEEFVVYPDGQAYQKYGETVC